MWVWGAVAVGRGAPWINIPPRRQAGSRGGMVIVASICGASGAPRCCHVSLTHRSAEVVEDDHGVPLSVGRKRRTIAGALKRALYRRDTTCTYPGCTHRIFLEGQHLRHWADGGETSLMNTALLCSSHHRYVHEYGYIIELGPDQRPRFRDPTAGRLPRRHRARCQRISAGHGSAR